MKTTVVIPNYNGKHFLQDCLDSLLQSTVEFAVIVVDNGSTDGSVSWIQEHFPEVKLICFSENKGFCTAVNTGIEAAATPYVFLLNNDTKTDRFCLERLERAMEADGKISEDEFVKALFVNNVTVFVNGSKTGFYIDLDAEPDYFMGHLVCIEVDCKYKIEVGGFNG